MPTRNVRSESRDILSSSQPPSQIRKRLPGTSSGRKICSTICGNGCSRCARRGGQLAGFSGAVIALVGANAESMLVAVHQEARVASGIVLLAGTILLVLSFVTALRGTLLPGLVSDISAQEIANYTTERFTHEADLWRVHVRTINGLLLSIDSTTRQGDKARGPSWTDSSSLGFWPRDSPRYPYCRGDFLMPGPLNNDPPIEPVPPAPPAADVPLDQTTAPIHYEGDTDSVRAGTTRKRRISRWRPPRHRSRRF